MNKHAINIISYYLEKVMRSGCAVSSHSVLIPSETVYEKKGIALADCEKGEFDLRAFGCLLYHFCM